jgi:hypothetical protein
VDAARDLNTLDQNALELQLDQIAKGVRDNWILQNRRTWCSNPFPPTSYPFVPKNKETPTGTTTRIRGWNGTP